MVSLYSKLGTTLVKVLNCLQSVLFLLAIVGSIYGLNPETVAGRINSFCQKLNERTGTPN